MRGGRHCCVKARSDVMDVGPSGIIFHNQKDSPSSSE